LVSSKNSTTSSNKNNESSVDPWFITGLFDAESSFVVTILKTLASKQGEMFKLEFN
jgi:hypothetical protein